MARLLPDAMKVKKFLPVKQFNWKIFRWFFMCKRRDKAIAVTGVLEAVTARPLIKGAKLEHNLPLPSQISWQLSYYNLFRYGCDPLAGAKFDLPQANCMTVYNPNWFFFPYEKINIDALMILVLEVNFRGANCVRWNDYPKDFPQTKFWLGGL